MPTNPYPSDSMIQDKASSYGANALHMYAYAAVNVGLPSSVPSFQQWEASQISYAQSLATGPAPPVPPGESRANQVPPSLDPSLLFGYEQETGSANPSAQTVTQWAIGRNYLSQNGGVSYSPVAGLNYIGDSTNFNNPAPAPGSPTGNGGTPPSSQPASGGLNLSSITSQVSALAHNQTVQIGAAGLATLWVYKQVRRRR